MFFKNLIFKAEDVNVKCFHILKFTKTSLRYFSSGVGENTINFTPPWKILFLGTDEFAMTHLKALNENCLADNDRIIKSVEVVTPKLDKCAVGNYASSNNLKCFKWPLPKQLDNYDVGVVVSFGHLIPKRVIDAFPYGILNVHPSLLPRWRGASPVSHAILNGDHETGVSIMQIQPACFDAGPSLMQAKLIISDDMKLLTLTSQLATMGSNMLLEALRNLPKLEKLKCEQIEENVTYAHKFSNKIAKINWEKQTLSEVDRQYRAFSEFYDLRSLWNGQKVKLLGKLSLKEMKDESIQLQLEALPSPQPGSSQYLDSHKILCIKCKDGWVGFRGIVLKKKMSVKMFYNGYLSRHQLKNIPFESQENDLDKHLFSSLVRDQMKLKQPILKCF